MSANYFGVVRWEAKFFAMGMQRLAGLKTMGSPGVVTSIGSPLAEPDALGYRPAPPDGDPEARRPSSGL
jgi:hypothetical protein